MEEYQMLSEAFSELFEWLAAAVRGPFLLNL